MPHHFSVRSRFRHWVSGVRNHELERRSFGLNAIRKERVLSTSEQLIYYSHKIYGISDYARLYCSRLNRV